MKNKQSKLVDSLTFYEMSGNWHMSVQSMVRNAKNGLVIPTYLEYFRICCPAAVALAAQAFLVSREYLRLSYDGKIFIWHMDKYGNIIYRVCEH